MKKYIFILSLLTFGKLKAQELFVFTEPASNMATKSIGIRVKNMLMKDLHAGRNTYLLNPEIMWGVSKKVMIHGDIFFSDMDGSFYANGGSLYLKYRFLSVDEVHNHFRMAAFGRYSFNNAHIHEYAIDLNGHNSGYEGGVVATQLINRVAVSAGTSLVHATDNSSGEKFLFGDKLRNAFNYTFSAGTLLLPREYTSYKQTNLNLMLEFLGQSNLHNGYSYFDMAPSVQLIFNSRLRVDMGYRFALIKKLQRYASDGALLRLEYNFFNVY